MTETNTGHAINPNIRRKLFAGVLILVGLSLVIGVVYFALVPNAEGESGSLPKTVAMIIAFLFGAGANVKGWIDLFKKPPESTKAVAIGDNPQVTTGDNSPIVQGTYIARG